MLLYIKSFLKLMRWFHELLAILPFLGLFLIVDHYAKKSGASCSLSGFHFIILCFCVQLLIAAGMVLNDIMDRDIDKINKPKTHIVGNTISLRHAKIIFTSISLLALAFSIYISLYVFIEWAFISSIVYLLSILYDVYLKRAPLLGNITMALLTAFIPIVLYFFAKDCITELHNERINVLIILYAAFPFLIIIPRELSLDISDMEGDKKYGCNTLPIAIGIRKSKLVVAAFLILIIFLSFWVMLKYDYLVITLLIIDILIVVYLYKFKDTHERLAYIKIGRFLWFIMILGLVGFTLSILYF